MKTIPILTGFPRRQAMLLQALNILKKVIAIALMSHENSTHTNYIIINKGFSIATFDNQDTQETVIFPGPSYPFIILHPIRVGGGNLYIPCKSTFKSKRFGWYLKAINHGFRM